MKDNVDFIGLSEFEVSDVVIEADDGDSDGAYRRWSFGMIGAGCTRAGNYIEPIRLYYNTNNWELVESYPSAFVCQDPETPPIATPEDPWNCGSNDVVPNTLSGQCCSCTYSVAKIEANPTVKDRSWVAGIFKQPENSVSKNFCGTNTFLCCSYGIATTDRWTRGLPYYIHGRY